MPKYTVAFSRSARKDLERLDAVIVERVFFAVESLSIQPRPRGCRKLRVQENLWRIRIGDYRVVYLIGDEEKLVDIIAVRHRSEVYK